MGMGRISELSHNKQYIITIEYVIENITVLKLEKQLVFFLFTQRTLHCTPTTNLVI